MHNRQPRGPATGFGADVTAAPTATPGPPPRQAALPPCAPWSSRETLSRSEPLHYVCSKRWHLPRKDSGLVFFKNDTCILTTYFTFEKGKSTQLNSHENKLHEQLTAE